MRVLLRVIMVNSQVLVEHFLLDIDIDNQVLMDDVILSLQIESNCCLYVLTPSDNCFITSSCVSSNSLH